MKSSRSKSAKQKRIILFRFHNHVEICKQRLRLLAALNPGMPIYGIYGGDRKKFLRVRRELSSLMTHCYCVPRIPRSMLMRMKKYKDMLKYSPTLEGVWKWKYCDFLINMWYRDVGISVDFESAILTEWDLLFFQSIDKLYKHVPRGAFGVTGLQTVKEAGLRWAITTHEPHRSEFEALLRHVRKRYGYTREPSCALGPGCSYPKNFLRTYSSIRVPQLSNDEIRIALFADVLGFPLRDTKLCPTWYDLEDFKLFNTNRVNVPVRAITRELASARGRRVFHPCIELLPESIMRRYCGRP